MSKTSCIILAGGKGARMQGKDKGLQRFGNKRLIEHVIAKISPQVDDIVLSANRHLAEYRQLGFTVVKDSTDRYNGPLAGIASAIKKCRHPWVLVVPCDMPALPDDLVAIMSRHTNASPLVTIRSHDQHQLIFLMHQNLISSINDCLAKGQYTVIRWVESVNAHIIAIDNDNYFQNINTIEQLTD